MRRTIVCFGDSNTFGYNARNGGRFSKKERWPGILQKLLGGACQVREEGLCGRTTVFEDPPTAGLCGLDALHSVLMSHRPVDLLIIMLGTNDVKERFSASPEMIADGMKQLIQKAKESCEAFTDEPRILMIAPPPIEPGYERAGMNVEMGKHCVEKSQALAALYKAVAENTGCFFLDAAKIKGMEMYSYDYIHLSPQAHRVLAEKLSELITEQIYGGCNAIES